MDQTGAETWQKQSVWRLLPRPKQGLDGAPQSLRELSESARKAVPYSVGLLAQSRKDGGRDPSDMTLRHLAVGTEAMDYARQKLIKGRGNVDANDPSFPEAHFRTDIGYKHFTTDHAKFAATAELLRAGNCDMHAATTYTYGGAHMDDKGVAAKVVHPGHTFSELRGPQGKTKVRRDDVIVDSWAGGKHAVLREDSYLARDIKPSSDRVAHPDHTQATADKLAGTGAFQRKQTIVANSQAFQQHYDMEAAKPQHRADPSRPITQGMWAETPIMSEEGKLATSQRSYTFRKGSTMLQDLQTVFTARKMGASIGGAAKLTTKR